MRRYLPHWDARGEELRARQDTQLKLDAGFSWDLPPDRRIFVPAGTSLRVSCAAVYF